MATLLFLVGVNGAGKTSTIQKLADTPHLTILQPSTTRPARPNREHEYDHVQVWDDDTYAWSIRVGQYSYGMRRSELDRVVGDRVCITVFDPASMETLHTFRRSFAHEIITVGLDTVHSDDEQRVRVENDASRIISLADLSDQREIVRQCDIFFDGTLDAVVKAVLSLIDLVRGRGGILTKKTITAFIRAKCLLSEAKADNVEPASYDLVVGDEAWCQGRAINLDDMNQSFAIPPYSYAIVKAHEHACFPKFVAGRFDLKVSLFFRWRHLI